VPPKVYTIAEYGFAPVLCSSDTSVLDRGCADLGGWVNNGKKIHDEIDCDLRPSAFSGASRHR